MVLISLDNFQLMQERQFQENLDRVGSTPLNTWLGLPEWVQKK